MLIYLVEKALEEPIVYRHLPEQVQGTQRDQGLIEGKPFPWSVFCFQTIKGPEMDILEPIEEKLTPHTLPLTWQQATIGNSQRHLVAEGKEVLLTGKSFEGGVLTPLCACTLFILIIVCVTGGQLRYGWKISPRIIDGILLLMYICIALLVTTLITCSAHTGTTWNWYFPAFNPIPVLLWLALPRWRKGIALCITVLMVATIAATPFIPQLDMEHALLITCFIIRLLTYFQIRNKEYNK